ncbi:PhoPQ-regulated protein [Pseudomonas vanderleydeniana]|uniref:PhoPQ-regulated protein n=2 Tax=Pseudomonas vanderleydeniana TaxID=2745495 RepID=A0A9E6PSZ8_9PSED|nr:PhoPQ-regulated protein [Pseudomonas vanderleydeniana]
MERLALPIMAVLMVGCSTPSIPRLAQDCFEASGRNFSEVLNCYKQAEAANPLSYTDRGSMPFPGGEVRHFILNSQRWSPDDQVVPEQWKHDVRVYIPDNALHETALLVANNGTNNPLPGSEPQPPTDLPADVAQSIATQTRTIVISVSDLPNQALTFHDSGASLREDSLVAQSWARFLKAPERQPFTSVHVPMMEALVKSMDLAERELRPWQIRHFIATGASKRAWTSWLATLNDERITGLIPFALDFLDMEEVIDHTYRVYGQSWPVAYGDYQREGITQQFHTANFKKLEAIHDPARYKDSAYAHRLSMRKYIVSASGDDFFPPDSLNLTFAPPGPTALRMIPNTGHGGIRAFVAQSLVPVVRQWQENLEIPTISARLQRGAGKDRYVLNFSRRPDKLLYWQAWNPDARDFRYACGIRYQASAIRLPKGLSVEVPIQVPGSGWSAGFFEATYPGGLISTSRVEIVPGSYPERRPPEHGAACSTIVDPTSR